MNTLTKGFAKRVISMLLVTIMVFSLGIVGLTSVSAANTELAETGAGQYNKHWIGNVYFLAPASWDIDTYSKIQVDITRTTSATNSNYQAYAGTMTRISGTRLFYKYIDLDHSSWNQNEYIAFTANSSEYSDGTFTLKTNHYYTTPLDYLCDTSSTTYFFKPASEAANNSSNGNTMSAEYRIQNNYEWDIADAAQTVNIQTNGASSGTGGSVKMTGYYLNDDHVSASSSSANSSGASVKYEGALQGSKMTLQATKKTNYNFVGWYSGSTLLSSNEKYEYTVFNAKTITAKFESAVSITNPTATINTESVVLGNSAEITVDYTLSGSSNTPTLTLCDANGTAIGSGTADVTVNGKVITVTPKVAGDYTFKVKITVDGVSTFTNTVTLNCKKEYSATIAVDNTTKYTGDTFTFTIADNSELYSGVTYTVYCDDKATDIAVTDKTFTASHDKDGKYVYYVVANVDGEAVYTDKVTITVKAKVFSVYLEAPKSTMEDRAFEVKATTEFAAGEVTYTLNYNDGTNDCTETNTTGIFNITIRTVGDYTLTVTASDGTNEVTATAKVTITEDKGTYPVKIFFKCSDTYGYLPNAKVDGTAVTLTKESSVITYNATDTATYSWYSYTVDGEVDYGTKITFAVNANRNYFYNASFTVSAGEGDYVQDGTYYCYYFALENLNGGTNTLSNISKLTEAERNWTESAVNMIYDDADALAPVALNFAYANMADANTDGKVNVKDATYIQKSLANIVEASALSTSVSDVNGDGKVTIKDATALQKQIAGL